MKAVILGALFSGAIIGIIYRLIFPDESIEDFRRRREENRKRLQKDKKIRLVTDATNFGGLEEIDKTYGFHEVKEQLSLSGDAFRPNKSPGNIIGFLVSLALFLGVGAFQSIASILLFIVVVILVHELGHVAAMRYFGYKDIGILFIPALGAVASGSKKGNSAFQRAIVTLSGSLLGIICGLFALLLYLKTKDQFYLTFSIIFLFLNGFNLLPFTPLDGGRFLECILGGSPKVVSRIRTLTSLALLGIAIYFKSWLLGLVALVSLWEAPAQNLVTLLSYRLRMDSSCNGKRAEDIIPDLFIQKVIRLLDLEGLCKIKPAAIAYYVSACWRKCFEVRSTKRQTVQLVTGYVVALSLAGSLFIGRLYIPSIAGISI